MRCRIAKRHSSPRIVLRRLRETRPPSHMPQWGAHHLCNQLISTRTHFEYSSTNPLLTEAFQRRIKRFQEVPHWCQYLTRLDMNKRDSEHLW